MKAGRKPIEDKERRKHPVTCRLTDDELAEVDGKRGEMTRGEWIRTFALKPRVMDEQRADLGGRAVSDEKLGRLTDKLVDDARRVMTEIQQTAVDRLQTVTETQQSAVGQLRIVTETQQKAVDQLQAHSKDAKELQSVILGRLSGKLLDDARRAIMEVQQKAMDQLQAHSEDTLKVAQNWTWKAVALVGVITLFHICVILWLNR